MSEAESKEEAVKAEGEAKAAEPAAEEAVPGADAPEAPAPEADAASEGAAAEAVEERAAAEPPPTAYPGSEDLRRQADDWKNRAYRAAADLENARRRFAREREDLRKFAVEALLKDLLPVVDNLERALSHAEGGDALVEGVRMVHRQFASVLEAHGAKPFDALGKPFDPSVHEAMTELVTADQPPGTVVQVFQRGWMLNDRLVRPAMVIVAKAPESAGEA